MKLEQILEPESTSIRTLLLGLLGLVVLYFFMMIIETSRIEKQLSLSVNTALVDAGFIRIHSDIRGRDIILKGQVASHQALKKSITLAAKIDGVRIVRADITIHPMQLPYIKFRFNQNKITGMSGSLSDSGLLENLVPRTNLKFAATISQNPELAEAKWLPAIEQLIVLGKRLQKADVEIGAGVLDFGGTTDDPAVYLEVEGKLNTLAEKWNLRIVNRVATVSR